MSLSALDFQPPSFRLARPDGTKAVAELRQEGTLGHVVRVAGEDAFDAPADLLRLALQGDSGARKALQGQGVSVKGNRVEWLSPQGSSPYEVVDRREAERAFSQAQDNELRAFLAGG